MERVGLTLPAWLDALNRQPRGFADEHAVMSFAIEVARQNIDHEGGPFAAVVVSNTLELVAVGANRVTDSRCSLWHAEMLALAIAQKRLHTHDLETVGRHTLFSSCAPCAMCLGALPFSGISGLCCAARSEDAEAIGFDEGDRPAHWAQTLHKRGISVKEDLCRTQALEVFSLYRQRGGPIY